MLCSPRHVEEDFGHLHAEKGTKMLSLLLIDRAVSDQNKRTVPRAGVLPIVGTAKAVMPSRPKSGQWR